MVIATPEVRIQGDPLRTLLVSPSSHPRLTLCAVVHRSIDHAVSRHAATSLHPTTPYRPYYRHFSSVAVPFPRTQTLFSRSSSVAPSSNLPTLRSYLQKLQFHPCVSVCSRFDRLHLLRFQVPEKKWVSLSSVGDASDLATKKKKKDVTTYRVQGPTDSKIVK